jgi:hypothetical protein
MNSLLSLLGSLLGGGAGQGGLSSNGFFGTGAATAAPQTGLGGIGGLLGKATAQPTNMGAMGAPPAGQNAPQPIVSPAPTSPVPQGATRSIQPVARRNSLYGTPSNGQGSTWAGRGSTWGTGASPPTDTTAAGQVPALQGYHGGGGLAALRNPNQGGFNGLNMGPGGNMGLTGLYGGGSMGLPTLRAAQ